MGKFKVLDFDVVIEKDPDGGFVAFVPALPGCFTQGETIDEVLENIKEAIELYLEELGEVPEKLPAFVGIHRVSVSVKTS